MFNHQQIPAVVTWDMPVVRFSSAYYYTATYLNDLALAQHTCMALSTICTAIRQQHPEFGNDWEIVYLVTKPLDFLNQTMSHGYLDLPNAGAASKGDDNDNEDDEGEE